MEGMELEEMRNQIAILKNKIQAEEIVNDRLLRQVSKSKLSVMNSQAYKTLFLSLICIPLYLLMYYETHLSFAFCIFTICYVMFSGIATLLIHYPVMTMNMATENLKSVVRKVSRVKRQYRLWLMYITPTIIPWIMWCVYEMLKANDVELNSSRGMLIACTLLIAAGIGATIGLRMHFKVVNACSDILDQIDRD